MVCFLHKTLAVHSMPVKRGLNSEVAATQRLGIVGVHYTPIVILRQQEKFNNVCLKKVLNTTLVCLQIRHTLCCVRVLSYLMKSELLQSYIGRVRMTNL